MLDDYFPQRVNSGPWVTAYTLDVLRKLPAETEFILPICSLATPYVELASLGDHLLPPLFHEALNPDLQRQLVERIVYCFPNYASEQNRHRVRVVELPAIPLPVNEAPQVLAFSVDTAVEEHGPHLPLGTDTIQSYGILQKLAKEFAGFELARPVEYGQLTWGLPFGHSIDIATSLLTAYVTGYCNALVEWRQPESLYVVDVHGSITHRQAIVEGIKRSFPQNWAFRWLHDPLAEFASERGDQHAGGVETVLVQALNPGLIDSAWWPDRMNDIAAQQMSFEKAVELTPDLPGFCAYVHQHRPNGVIGDITNALRLDASLLLERILKMARGDVRQLLAGHSTGSQTAGQKLW